MSARNPQQGAAERPPAVPAPNSPWVYNTLELGRSPGTSRAFARSVVPTERMGLDFVRVPDQAAVELDLVLESVLEGVLARGTATAPLVGECARCLDEFTDEVTVELTELYAYPGSATEESTDADEVLRVVDDRIDLEPVVRDAVLLALPHAPVCSEQCDGLCAGCGEKWSRLEPGHHHETIDPRWAALQERFGELEEE